MSLGKVDSANETVHILKDGNTVFREVSCLEEYPNRSAINGHYSICKTCLQAESATPSA